MYELDSDSDDDEDSGKHGTGNASTISELSSQGTNIRSIRSVPV